MNLKKIVLASILGALSVIIDMVFKLVIPISTIGTPFYAIPIIIIGLFLGVKYSVIIAFLADLITVLIAGIPFFPIFSLGSMMWGIFPALFLKPENKIWKKSLFIVVTYLLVTLINSIGLYIHYHKSFVGLLADLPIRLGLIIPNTIVIVALVEALIEPVKIKLYLTSHN